jgi:hypothetical protein
MLYLHGSVWHDLTYRLIEELARSVGLAYLQRFETIRVLLEHRIASSWLLRAAGDYLMDPAVQVVQDPVGVLEVSHSPEAAAVLLDKFVQTESEVVFDAAVAGLAYKVARGQYGRTNLERIEATLLRAMRNRSREISGLEELMVAMPESAQARLMDAARGLRGHQDLALVAAHGEWVRPDVARRVTQEIADDVRALLPSAALYDEDPMTPRILREALFSARGTHRHVSSLLLLGSPFRSYVAAALAARIDAGEGDRSVTECMLRLLRYVVGEEQESLLLKWIPGADRPTACDMALALGHLPESSELDRAVLYALGMRRDEALVQVAKDDGRATPVRDAASWWLRQGGAVFE